MDGLQGSKREDGSDRIVLVQRSLKQSHVNVAQRSIQPRHCQLSQPCRLEPIASAAPCPTGGASAQLAHNAAGGRSGVRTHMSARGGRKERRAHAYERTRRALLVVAGFGVRRGVGHPTPMQAARACVAWGGPPHADAGCARLCASGQVDGRLAGGGAAS
jgi:hypothetical protein